MSEITARPPLDVEDARLDGEFVPGDRFIEYKANRSGVVLAVLGSQLRSGDSKTTKLRVRWDDTGEEEDASTRSFTHLISGTLRLAQVPKLSTGGSYNVTVRLASLESMLADFKENYALELNPDFQRGHVWSEDKQIAFVEYLMRDGKASRKLYFNCPTFQRNANPNNLPMHLVDGLQRLTAIRRFHDGEIPAFGQCWSEWSAPDRRHMEMQTFTLEIYVNDLLTREEVLSFYIELNSGGVAHTEAEIERVKALRDAERTKAR